MTAKQRVACPWCGSLDTFTYYQLNMPNILSACSAEMLNAVRVYPFEARLCRQCLLGFNASKLGGDELRTIYDQYLYISPLDGIGREKYDGMLRTIKAHFRPDADLVEIGCCDGYLLSELQKAGYTRLSGIEPGPQVERAKALGLNVQRGYFDGQTFGRKVDGFILMHVFEHFESPFTMLAALRDQLKPGGKIIIEVPDFDGYHHQHLYFYNEHFLARMCRAWGMGLAIIDQQIENGALRVVLTCGEQERELSTGGAADIIRRAEQQYADCQATIARLNHAFAGHGPIYWWGAGSSSVVYLNQIRKGVLAGMDLMVVDGDKAKWGLHIPGVDVQVRPFAALPKSIETLHVASSFYREIAQTCEQNGIKIGRVEVVI